MKEKIITFVSDYLLFACSAFIGFYMSYVFSQNNYVPQNPLQLFVYYPLGFALGRAINKYYYKEKIDDSFPWRF